MKKKKKSKRLFFLVVLIVLTGLIGGSIWLVFFSRYFQIKKIVLQKENSQPKIISLNLPNQKLIGLIDITKNIVFFRNSFIKQQFNSPDIKKVKVLKDYKKREVFIKISKRKEKIIWCFSKVNKEFKRCFSTDKEGIAFKESAIINGINEPIVFQYLPTSSSNSFLLGKKISNQKEINFILTVYKTLSPIFKKLNLEIMPEDREKLIAIVNDGSFKIFFNLKQDYIKQLNAFKEVYSDFSKRNIKIEYIDLQSLPRVYYK